MPQENDTEMNTTDPPNTNTSANNGNTINNPYLDPLLMQGLQQFSPQQNEQYIVSHKVDSIKTKLNTSGDNDTVMKQ